MSLSKDDIRETILEALEAVVSPRFDHIEITLDEHSQKLDEHSQKLDEHSRVLNAHTHILNEHTHILREHEQRLTRIEQKVDNLDGKLRAIEADIKELYSLTGTKPVFSLDKKFAKQTSEEQVRSLYVALVALAEQLHIEL